MINKVEEYSALVNRYATPFYVFDEVGFVENLHKLTSALGSVYPNYRMAYSYKTNYTPYICKIAKENGAYAEVVSDMELTLALKLGYPNNRIIYNGPEKGPMMEGHLANNGIVNIDNLSEAFRIAIFAKSNPQKHFKVGLRINMHLDDAFVSRFGL